MFNVYKCYDFPCHEEEVKDGFRSVLAVLVVEGGGGWEAIFRLQACNINVKTSDCFYTG